MSPPCLFLACKRQIVASVIDYIWLSLW